MKVVAMRGTKIVLAVLAFLLLGMVAQADFLTGVFSFPLSEHTMAKEVGKFNEPVCRTYTFSQNDDQALSWMIFWRDLSVHSVEWRWCYPEGRVYARTFSVIPPTDGPAGMWAAPVWSCLKIKGYDPARMPGMWKVDIIVDYRKVFTEYFTINGAAAC